MARDLLISINAKDNASATFAKLGREAEAAGEKIDRSADEASAGIKDLQTTLSKMEAAFEKHSDESSRAITDLSKDVKTLATSVDRSTDEMTRSFREAEKATNDFGNAGQSLTRGFAALGGAFVMYSNQARDHERTIIAVQRMYGTAADSYIQFANTIQSNSVFSNEAALEAARIMGTLKENYDLTDAQIKKLIQTSADLASIHGYELPDAAQRVAAAIRGEAESAEMLGLTMNQAAIDTEGLTLKMTNAEAAAFRYDAMMKQTSSSVGAAAEVAATTTGKMQQLANSTQDAAMSFVDFTGPVGDAAGALTAFGVQGGLALGGIGQLVKGIGELNKSAGGAKLVGGLSTIIGGAGGTGGLAAAIAAAAGAALIAAPAILTLGGAVAYLAIEQGKLMGTMNEQTDALTRWANGMGKGGDALNDLIFFAQDFRDLTTEINLMDPWGALGDNGQIKTTVTTLNTLFDELMSLSPESIRQVEAALNDMGYSLGNLDQYVNDSAAMSDIAQVVLMAWANQIDQGIALATTVDKVAYAWMDYEQAQNQASIAAASNGEHLAAVKEEQERLATATNNTRTATSEQARAQDVLTDAMLRQEAAAADLLKSQTLLAQSRIDQMRPNLWDGGMPNETPTTGLAVDPLARRMAMMPQSAAAMSDALETMHHAYVSSVSAQVLAFMSGIDDVGGKFYAGFVEPVEQGVRRVGQSLEELEQARAEWQALAEDIYSSVKGMNPSSVLGDTMTGIVGAAQGFASLSQSVAKWSGSLAHAAEDQAADQTELNNLYQNGKISLTTYNAALDANHRIQQANVSVQEDALRIQAKQLPLMAQLAEENARYVDSIADMPVEQQMITLGYMDQAKAAQALQLAQLAAMSSTQAMQNSTTDMIAVIAGADPVMKAMLIDMGLITETETGIKVNFGDVDEGKKALDALTDTLGTFTEVIAEVFGINVKLNDDGAEARLAMILARMNELDGRSVTTYVNTIGLNSGALASTGRTFTPRYVTGGTHGGSYAVVGEHGPELTWLPNGAQVTNAPASREPIARMNSGGGNTYYNAPVMQTITLDNSSMARTQTKIAGIRR